MTKIRKNFDFTNMERKILILIITLLLLFLCFGVGYRKGRNSVEIKSDTVFVEKVIANYKPLYTNEIPVSIQKIKVPMIAVLSEYTDSSKQTVIKLKHSLDSLANLTDSSSVFRRAPTSSPRPSSEITRTSERCVTSSTVSATSRSRSLQRSRTRAAWTIWI